MTVLQNIASGIRKPKEERMKIAEEKVKAFYLDGLEKSYPFQLSGGQQQRAALARMLASEPEAILLDEPFSALDSYLKWQLELELKATLEAYEGPSVFVSHNRDEVYRLCDRVSVLDRGKSEPVVNVRALFEQPESLSACLLTGCKNFSRARRLDENRLEALDWAFPLRSSRPIPEDVRYIGVRAHFLRFVREPGENVIPCKVLRVTEDVFSTIIMLQIPGPEGDFSRLRIEMSKADWNAVAGPETMLVEVRPDSILMLR
jgi:molybdate transport system ATP-binding protein